MRRMVMNMLVVTVCAVALIGCSSDEQGEGTKVEVNKDEELAARIGDWTVTRDRIEQIIAQMPELEKIKYNTAGGRAELTDKLIEEEFYYQEGLKLGLDKDEEIVAAIENFTRGAVIGQYFRKEIEPLARPGDEEMFEYYEDHVDQFTREPIVRAQHVFSGPGRMGCSVRRSACQMKIGCL